MPRSPKVKAAVLERSRRSTAGKRMSSLVGKAQEDDDTFWSHSIWSETGGGFSANGSRKRRREDDGESSSSSGSEEGSGSDEDSVSDGEGSYRMSDEDSAAAVDQFDSDFDESESDEDEGDEEGEEERELLAEERREKASKRKKNQRLGAPLKSSAGRELLRKRTGKITKRGPLGEGWNEGLVLNWPPPPSGGIAPAVSKSGAAVAAPAYAKAKVVNSTSMTVPGAQQAMPAAPPAKPQHIPSHPATHSHIDAKTIAKRPPGPPPSRLLRTGPTSGSAPSTKSTSSKLKHQRQTATAERKKIPKPKFTQEELILECIKSTETENARWLSGRKRSKEEAAQQEKAAGAKKSSLNQKPISRFHSRRGCTNTLTFMDMDHLPQILTRSHATAGGYRRSPSTGRSPRRRRLDSTTSETSESAPTSEKHQEKCIITGKIARYRDPKTMLFYHDLDAYKELKRRVESGELTVSQNHEQRRSTGSTNGVIAQRRGPGADNTTNFPFSKDHPTMDAEVISSRRPKAVKVKVMVTQNGVPVSPPIAAKAPLKLPLPGEQPSLPEGSPRSIEKELPPLPSARQIDSSPGKLADISQFLMGRMEMDTKEQQQMQYVASSSSNANVTVPRGIASNQSHVSQSAVSTKSAPSEKQPHKVGATGALDASGKGEDTEAKPQMTVTAARQLKVP